MDCRDARPLLVAHFDGELSPSAHHLVEAHLDDCWACRARAERLERLTPEHALVIPPDVLDQLASRVSLEQLAPIAAERPSPAPATPGFGAWLAEPLGVSRLAVFGYVVVLAGAIGWGLSQGALPSDTGAPATASTEPMPAGQYRPASWTPQETEEPDAGGIPAP